MQGYVGLISLKEGVSFFICATIRGGGDGSAPCSVICDVRVGGSDLCAMGLLDMVGDIRCMELGMYVHLDWGQCGVGSGNAQ